MILSMEMILLLILVMGFGAYRLYDTLPDTLRILGSFLFVSLSVELLSSKEFLTIANQVGVQIFIELIFISVLLNEVFVGHFYWRLSFLSVILHAIGSYAIIGIFHNTLSMTLPFEIALQMAMYISSFALLTRITLRVKKLSRDYRFWSVLGINIYYLVANFIFYMEWSSKGATQLWWVQQIAFVLSMACFACALVSWHVNKDAILEHEERFLLPPWLFRRLLYFFEDLGEEVHVNYK